MEYAPEFQRYTDYWFPVVTATQLGDLVRTAKESNRRLTIVRPYDKRLHCMVRIGRVKIYEPQNYRR